MLHHNHSANKQEDETTPTTCGDWCKSTREGSRKLASSCVCVCACRKQEGVAGESRIRRVIVERTSTPKIAFGQRRGRDENNCSHGAPYRYIHGRRHSSSSSNRCRPQSRGRESLDPWTKQELGRPPSHELWWQWSWSECECYQQQR